MSVHHVFTFGTHNLHDEAGVPTFFADVVVFTEAIAPTIVALAQQKLAHAKGRLRGYRIVVCREQPDLVIVFRRRLFKRRGGYGYKRIVDGRERVTPNRGTMWQPLEHRATSTLFDVMVEHRINGAFPPYIRGEAEFRHKSWRRHTAWTCGLIHRLTTPPARDDLHGHVVLSAGDLNVPRDQAGYPGVVDVQELGEDLQRLAVTPRWKWSMDRFRQLSRKGSDHPRDMARVREVRPTPNA